MVKLKKIIDDYGMLIVIGIGLILMFKTCGINNRIEKCNKDVININNTIDSLKTSNNNNFILLDINIKQEGLKSEYRMITATDRTIMDVTRQNEINREIKKLEDEKKSIKIINYVR